jgi:hypothetical protein
MALDMSNPIHRLAYRVALANQAAEEETEEDGSEEAA